MLDSSVTISEFIHKLCKWAHLYCWQFNQLVTNGLSHPYHLDESTFILDAAGVTFHFYFAFYYIYIGSGTARWRHGWFRITPVSPRRRPGGDTVAPGVFPVYHGIWQPSRLLPVSPGCFKHFKTTGDMSRFNTVHPGSPSRRMAENGFAPPPPPPPPREFCRHILSCRELKAESFKRCLHSVLRGVSL